MTLLVDEMTPPGASRAEARAKLAQRLNEPFEPEAAAAYWADVEAAEKVRRDAEHEALRASWGLSAEAEGEYGRYETDPLAHLAASGAEIAPEPVYGPALDSGAF